MARFPLKITAALWLFSWCSVSAGNIYCVRAGAARGGDGSSWDSALPAVPTRPERGAVYYVADGSYPSLTIATPAAGSSQITIKKATVAEHGPSAGWKDSYGDGTARFEHVSVAASFVVFDGAFGSGSGPYGFEVYNTAPADKNFHLLRIEADVDDVVIRHVELHRPGIDYKGRGINATGFGNERITIADCYVHDLFGVHVYLYNATDVVIERCVFARNKSTPDWHSESIQARGTVNFTVRWCWFEDIQGTAVIISGSGNSASWDIHGNVFYATPGFSQANGHGTVADNQRDSIRDVRVHNNTFVGIKGFKAGVRFWNSSGGCYAFNNLYYDCRGVGYVGTTADYNSYYDCEFKTIEFQQGTGDTFGRGSPFVDAAGGDFHLQSPTEPGWDKLDARFARDPDGLVRGADGLWDRGAYEYSALEGLLPPRNLRIRP